MTETFLVLLAAGVMLAAAISDPKQVTLQWLRLCGIIAVALVALAAFFFLRRDLVPGVTDRYRRVEIGQIIATAILVLGQLAFVQIARPRIGRWFAAAAFLVGVMAGCAVVHELMVARGTAVAFPSKSLSIALQTIACAGVAAMCGLVLMDMLLGHAYLTASRMLIWPFRRLNLALAVAMLGRAAVAIGLTWSMNAWHPVDRLWGMYGLIILTRYLVGLGVAGVFVYMAHDCINRRSTQSATGILYVAGLLVFIGEISALYLLRETGLPF
jgi:hypothetical protein